MLDIQRIKDNPEEVREKSDLKGYQVDVNQILGFDDERRKLLKEVEELRQKRNQLAASNKNQAPSSEQITAGKEIKDQLIKLEHQLGSIELELNELLKAVPNMPLSDVPVGKSEAENVVIKTWGDKLVMDFLKKKKLTKRKKKKKKKKK